MVYQFKPGSRIEADPQAAGKMCETLAANGGLTAKRLLDANRDPTAPLHSEFEWNDAVAAEGYREQQAAHIIRSIVVTREEKEPEPVRAFINVCDISREYKPLSVVVKSPTLTAQMLEAARRDMEVFRQKYTSLLELAPIFTAIEDVFSNKKRNAAQVVGHQGDGDGNGNEGPVSASIIPENMEGAQA